MYTGNRYSRKDRRVNKQKGEEGNVRERKKRYIKRRDKESALRFGRETCKERKKSGYIQQETKKKENKTYA
jgi:hypothetical protein